MLHGGGWCLGGLENEELNCRNFAQRLGCVCLNVDYRLAPEHPFPAAVNDSWDALKWVRNLLQHSSAPLPAPSTNMTDTKQAIPGRQKREKPWRRSKERIHRRRHLSRRKSGHRNGSPCSRRQTLTTVDRRPPHDPCPSGPNSRASEVQTLVSKL